MTRRARVIAVLVATAVAAGAAWYVVRARPRADLPAIDLTGAEAEIAAAVEEARGEVLRAPRSAGAWGRLGMVLVAHQFYDEGNACLARAEELDPSEVRWPYLRGLTLLLSDGDAAVARFEKAVRVAGNRPGVRLALAEALLAQGRLDEAEVHFRRARDDDPRGPRAHLGLARIAGQRGDWPSARTHLAACADDPTTRKAARRLLAEARRAGGDAETAGREARQAEALPDDLPWPDPLRDEVERLRVGRQGRLERAERLLSEGRVPDALALLDRATRDDPGWDGAWLTLGQTLANLRDFPGAERALRAALRLTPQSVQANFSLGVVLFQRGKFADAEERFRAVTGLKPDHVLGHYNRGHCLSRQGKTAEAGDAFRAALRVRPAFAPAHSSLGELLAKEGRKAEAAEHFRRAVELDPDDAAAKKFLAD